MKGKSLATTAVRSKPAESPRAVLRIVNILDQVADHPNGCTLSFLSQAVGAPKSSLLNLLRGLVAGGYLDVVGGVYVLGAGSYRLAVTIAASGRLPELSRVVARRLSERTGETALISVLTSDHQIAFIDKFESSTSAIRAYVSIGERRPAYSSAGGRVVLAFLPPDQLDAFFAAVKIEKVTPATETRRARLKELLAAIRIQGYAITVGEAEAGLTGIAAPIFDNLGAPVGSLILAGPSERMEPHLAEWPQLVMEAAADLSRLRGFRNP